MGDVVDPRVIEAVQIERELARRDLLDFTQLTFPRYRPGKFHRELATVLTKFARGNIRRLLVTAPPRGGKSQLVSCHLPAFLLGLHPDAKIIAASHTHRLATVVSRQVKRIIEAPIYQAIFPDTRLAIRGSSVGNTADEWELQDTKGRFKAVGVKGALAGSGMDFGIVDDPYRNRQEAESQLMRDRLWEWWTSDFYTRAEGVAGIVVLHTRWSRDDLIGRLQEEGDWQVVNFPAIDEDGQSYWPEKFDLEKLENIRHKIGERNWASLYQQAPSPEDGSVFQRKWFNYYNRDSGRFVTMDGQWHDPTHWRRFATMDVAVTTKSSSDWTVVAVWAVSPDRKLFLVHLERVRVETPSLFPMIERIRRDYGRPVVYLEENGVGLPIFQMAAAQSLSVLPIRQHKDKLARAEAVTPMLARGDILFPRLVPWLSILEDELQSFPFGQFDDQVDAVSMAVQVLEGVGNVGRSVIGPCAVRSDPLDIAAASYPPDQRRRLHMQGDETGMTFPRADGTTRRITFRSPK